MSTAAAPPTGGPAGHGPGPGGPDAEDLRQAGLPPTARIGAATLVLVVAGGIWLAATYGHAGALVIPTVLTIAAAALLVVNVALLARVREFAWPVFFRVLGWALLAYLVIAGILEFVFLFDHTPGARLVLLSGLLLLFALDVPLLLAFSVARWQPVEADAG
mgnify:CR=1 FL=1